MDRWIAVFEPPDLTDRVVAILIGALYQIDLGWLRDNPRTPKLYHSGVRYREEPRGKERWRSIPRVLELGWGDCEDLACWLAAERTLEGRATVPTFRSRRVGGSVKYHILVRRPDGRLEDPSRVLGM